MTLYAGVLCSLCIDTALGCYRGPGAGCLKLMRAVLMASRVIGFLFQ